MDLDLDLDVDVEGHIRGKLSIHNIYQTALYLRMSKSPSKSTSKSEGQGVKRQKLTSVMAVRFHLQMSQYVADAIGALKEFGVSRTMMISSEISASISGRIRKKRVWESRSAGVSGHEIG